MDRSYSDREGDPTVSGRSFAIPSPSLSLGERRNFVDVTICSPVEDIVKVGVTVHYALVVIAVDTVRDICDVALVVAYDLLTAVRANQNHVEDAADRFTAAVRATGALGSQDGLNVGHSDSLTALSGAMEMVEEGEEEEETEEDDKARIVPTPIELSKSLSMHVALTEACIVVLEDPRRESSAAFTMTLGADAEVGLDEWGEVTDESQEAVHCSLKGRHISVLSDTGRWLAAKAERQGGEGQEQGQGQAERALPNRHRTSSAPPKSIGTGRLSFCNGMENVPGMSAEEYSEISAELCESLSLDVHYTRKTVKGVALASNIAFNIGDLSVCLSLPHLLLARSIMLRGTLSGLAPLRSREPDYHCVIGDTRGNRGTQVDVFTIVFNVGNLTITAVDDVSMSALSRSSVPAPAPLPLVRVQLLSLQLNADGVLNPRVYVSSRTIRYTMDVLNLEGNGCLAVSADFFNPNIAHWEPLVEEWTLTLSLSKEEQGISCAVGDDLCPLRLNMSGKFLDVMINKYAEWVRGESEKRAVRPSHPSSSRSNSTAAAPRSSSLSMSMSALLSSRSSDGQEQGRFRFDAEAGEGRARAATMCDMNYEECEERDEVSDLCYPTLTPPETPEESEIHGPHLVLHNRLLCDLYYKAVQRDLSASPAPPTRTSTPTPAGQFASYFYSNKNSSPPSAGNLLSMSMNLSFIYLFLTSLPHAPTLPLILTSTSPSPPPSSVTSHFFLLLSLPSLALTPFSCSHSLLLLSLPSFADLSDTEGEKVLAPGRSKTLSGVDTSLRSHYLLVRVAGCAYSTLQLHSDKDKKSTIDLYEQLDSRYNKGWQYGDDKGDIKLSLRAHSTSRPLDVDEESLSSSSLSSLLSPAVQGSLVTELVIYTEGAFIDRSGLRLKLRATRQGAYVERCAWHPRGRGTAVDKGKEKGKDLVTARQEPFSSLVEAGRNLILSLRKQVKSKPRSKSTSSSGSNNMSLIASAKDAFKSISIGIGISRGAGVAGGGTGSGSSKTADSPGEDAFDLTGFTVQSRRVYRVVPKVRVGDVLYTDRAHLVWFYLPSVLR